MKSFPSLYVTNLFLIIGTSLLTTYLALYLGKNEVSTFWIGLMTSCYYIGLLFGSKVGYHFISSVGHIRTFAASSAAVAACVAAHGVTDNIYIWLVLRVCVGLGMMCNYMVLESWLNEQAAPEQRGKIFSIYMTTSYLGTMLGQIILSGFPDLDYKPLFIVAMAFAIGIVPISITRRIHPKALKPIEVSYWDYFKKAPQALTAMLFAGILSGSFYGLAPTFAKLSGFSPSEIATFTSLSILAGLLAQWPMGLLSDKFRRSVLIRANTAGILLVSLAFFILPITQMHSYILTFLFGIFVFTLYPLSSALANSRANDDERVGISSALLISFGAGAAIGSTGNAQVMSFFGHQSLYASFVVLTVIMLVVLTYINSTQHDEQPDTSDYMVGTSDVMSSPLAATLDPRIEEVTAHDQMLVVDDLNEYTEDPQQDFFPDLLAEAEENTEELEEQEVIS